jgi:hypothetical protein
MRLLTLGFFLLSYTLVGLSQADQFTIHLKNGDFIPQKNANAFIVNPSYSTEDLFSGSYFRMLQFEETPSKKDKEELAAVGIKLYGYLPEKTFYASLNENANLNLLLTKSVRSIIELDNEFTLSEALYSKKYPDWALLSDNRIELTAIHFDDLSELAATAALEKMGAEITMKSGAGIISFICPLTELDRFYSIQASIISKLLVLLSNGKTTETFLITDQITSTIQLGLVQATVVPE